MINAKPYFRLLYRDTDVKSKQKLRGHPVHKAPRFYNTGDTRIHSNTGMNAGICRKHGLRSECVPASTRVSTI